MNNRTDAGLEAAYAHCRQVTRQEARNFYFAFLTLPPSQRRAICAVYAFCRLCDDAVDAQTGAESKLAALTELRANLHQAYGGRPAGPVFLALADTAARRDIPQAYLDEIIQGVETDLVKTRYRDFDELRLYCYRVASVVGLVCLQIFGYRDPAAQEFAIDLGLAMQLTNILRDVNEDLTMGRIYLPQDEIARFGYSEEWLQARVHNEALIRLLQFQAQRARRYFQSGFRLLPYLSRRSRACPAVLGALYSGVLDRIEASNYDVLSGRRISLTTGEKLRITARTWLGSVLANPAAPGRAPQPPRP